MELHYAITRDSYSLDDCIKMIALDEFVLYVRLHPGYHYTPADHHGIWKMSRHELVYRFVIGTSK